MHEFYVGCDVEPVPNRSGNNIICATSQATIYTGEEIALTYQPPISVTDAHVIGGAMYMFFFAVWKGKQISTFWLGGSRDKS